MQDPDSFDIDADALYDDDDVEVHRLTRIDPNILGRQNFFFGKTLGEGAFARVVHAKMKNGFSPEYAIKIMEKAHIHKEKKVTYVMMEKQILSSLSHPYIIKLNYTFHDKDYLYMCMDLAAGGELSRLIRREQEKNLAQGITETACNIETTQFYMAELVLALEYLHSNRIIHMDLKPENILLTRDGHIKVADFGTALKVVDNMPLDDIFVGTAQYVSPEILEGSNITISCDLWAFGCIVYQMLCGLSPFQADTEYLMFQVINNHLDGSQPIKYPPCVTEAAHDLVEAMLKEDPSQRLGSSTDDPALSYEALKNHLFFEGIDWSNLSHVTPPFIPNPSDMPDASNMKDGALDDWILEGEATMLEMEDDIELEPQILTKSMRANKWSAFLTPGENLIFNALTWKRKGLFSKKRQLLLTSTPRLIYVDPDPENMEEKGQIPWTADRPLKCVLLKGEFFDIVCTLTGRSYHFRNADGAASSPQVWRQYINEMNQQFSI